MLERRRGFLVLAIAGLKTFGLARSLPGLIALTSDQISWQAGDSFFAVLFCNRLSIGWSYLMYASLRHVWSLPRDVVGFNAGRDQHSPPTLRLRRDRSATPRSECPVLPRDETGWFYSPDCMKSSLLRKNNRLIRRYFTFAFGDTGSLIAEVLDNPQVPSLARHLPFYRSPRRSSVERNP
jgi:hypothetical protein